MATATTRSRSVELFVRSLSPSASPAPAHVERVRDLRGDDAIEEVTVTVWGREIALSTTARRTDPGGHIHDRIASFRAWAADNDVTMAPFFETRDITSTITGEEYAALSLPVSCLAEYEDGELVHVAPYCTGDAVCCVADRLDRLDDGRVTLATNDQSAIALGNR